MLNLLSRLFVFFTISILFGFIAKSIGIHFAFGVLFGVSIQFVINYALTTFFDIFVSLKNKKLENERIKEFSFQGVEVECPCHKKIKEFVPFRFNSENKYKCTECSKTISVFADTYTAIATEPILDTDTTKIETIINNATS